MPRIAQRLCSSLLLAASLSLLEQSHAQKHLGMKIAAGRYGNAWNSGHRESVNAQVTDDFAEELSRIPDSAWASAPRGGQGTIMGTSKSGSTGMVSVMTDQGPAQIAVTGRGFRWKVDDIYRAGDDGNIVSTKEQIRASRSTLDFMQGLRATSQSPLYGSVTSDFGQALSNLAPHELKFIRSMVPISFPKRKPFVSMTGGSATIVVEPPDGKPGDRVTFHVVQSNGWRVADYSIETSEYSIPSFKGALPAIAAARNFDRFVKNPSMYDPAWFISNPELLWALRDIRNEGAFPNKPNEKAIKTSFSPDGMVVNVQFPSRLLTLTMNGPYARRNIDQIVVKEKNNTMDVAKLLVTRAKAKHQMLAMMKKVRETPVGGGIIGILSANPRDARRVSDDGLQAASVEERVVLKPAIPATRPMSQADASSLADSTDAGIAAGLSQTPAVKLVTYQPVQPTNNHFAPTVNRPRTHGGRAVARARSRVISDDSMGTPTYEMALAADPRMADPNFRKQLFGTDPALPFEDQFQLANLAKPETKTR